MGAFTEAAPVLAGLGVPTIPTRAEAPHVPRVKHPESLRVGTMQKLLNRPGLASANAAILCGPISGISVVDVDSPYPIHHEAALEAFGDTPLKISTPSGGVHLYYRHNGEIRSIKPFGEACPLDILGGGLAVLAPSHRPLNPETPDKKAGDYRVLEGRLEDLRRLPFMKDATARLGPVQAAHMDDIQVGKVFRTSVRAENTQPGGTGRNVDLFHALIQAAHHVPTLDALLIEARAINASFTPPLPDSEAVTVARKVWQYRESGNLWGGEARAVVTASELDALAENPYAAILLMKAQTAWGWRSDKPFPVARSWADSLGWTLPRFRSARDFLTELGMWHCVHAGGSGPGDPPLYQFGSKGYDFTPLNNKPPPPSLGMQSESKEPDQSGRKNLSPS